jgi:enamine deaminase RidA (YjgF/YER057c/UK114 family)
MTIWRWLALVCLFSLASLPAQRKNKEEETQTLQLPRELPGAVEGDTARLTFHVTPLSAKGLLSQQVRQALKAMEHQAGHETVLHIRAFVAGSGDLRRVRDLVSEWFTDRKRPLPTLSLIQAGGLPLEGAQVVFEYVAEARNAVNPGGLGFLSPRVAASNNPQDAVPPLTAKSLAALRQNLEAAGSQPADVLRVTCFVSSLDNLAASRQLVAAAYPKAAPDFVQTERAPTHALAACEAVARLKADRQARLRLMDSADGLSQIALVASPRIVLTGTQVSFGYEEKDARLAFDRLQHELEHAGASMADVAVAHYYPLSAGIAAQVRKVRAAYFSDEHPPAGSMLLFEGLPSMDAGFAIDAVAAKN